MTVLSLLVAQVLLLAYLSGREARFGRVAIATATLGLVLPWLLPASWIAVRALTGLSVVWLLAMTIDLVRRPEAMGYARRIWCLVSPFDARSSRAVAARLSLPLLSSALFWLLPALLGFALAFADRGLLLRWLGGVLGFYGSVEVVTRLMEAAYLAQGIAIPKTQDHPISSCSVAEFWGRRWNRPVSRWLRFHCFLPLARRGHARMGILASFVASGALHFYFVVTSLGARMAMAMAAFFVLQWALLLLESAMHVRAWPSWLARSWTVAVLVLFSPLFVEAILQILEASSAGL